MPADDMHTQKGNGADAPAPGVAREPLWTKDFIAGTLSNLMFYINYFMLLVIMTQYALDAYGVAASAAAFCASIFVVGTLVARFLTSPVLARISTKTLLIIGNVGFIVFSALYLTNISFAFLMVVRFFHGMAFGFCTTALASSVTVIIPMSRKGEGISYYMLSNTFGNAIGPFISIFLSAYIGYSLVFICSVIASCIALPCILLMKAPSFKKDTESSGQHPSDTASREELAEASDEISAQIMEAPKESEREMAESSLLEKKASKGDPDSRHLRDPGSAIRNFIEVPVVSISLVCGLVYFGYSSILTFLDPYATEAGLEQAASVFFIVYAASLFITRPFMGRAFDRRGPRIVMVPAFLSVMAGMVLVAFSVNGWILLASAVFIGFGTGNLQSCGLAMAVSITPDERLNLANATFFIAIDMGVGFGPLILGFITPLIGYGFTFLCAGGLAAISLILFLAICGKYIRLKRQ